MCSIGPDETNVWSAVSCSLVTKCWCMRDFCCDRLGAIIALRVKVFFVLYERRVKQCELILSSLQPKCAKITFIHSETTLS